MEECILKGTVIHFNTMGMFGFIRPDERVEMQPNVFFHIVRKRFYYCDGGDEPSYRFCDLAPKCNDRVGYIDEIGPKGPRAVNWWLLASYEEAVLACSKRILYRFRQRMGAIPKSRLHTKPTYTELWQGKNLKRLRSLYPKNHYPLKDNDYSGYSIDQFDEENNIWLACEPDPR